MAEYDSARFPPAPTVEVWFGAPEEAFAVGPIRALIDTGADICIIPLFVAGRIGARAHSLRYLRRYGETSELVRVFTLDIGIGTVRLPGMLVAADEAADEIIIGRNVLNRLTILLDGPHQVITIAEAQNR